MPQNLSPDDWNTLMRIASDAVFAATHRRKPEAVQIAMLPEALRQEGAVFVTLTKSGQLRGCIGSLEAWQPLAEQGTGPSTSTGSPNNPFMTGPWCRCAAVPWRPGPRA